MINRFFRRLSVQTRILGGFFSLVVLSVIAISFLIYQNNNLINDLQNLTSVEASTDRLLLLASRSVATSQVNLSQYLLDYSASPDSALQDANQAISSLQEAQGLLTSPDQKSKTELPITGLSDYINTINQLQQARSSGDNQTINQLEAQASKLGNDIGQQIISIVKDRETSNNILNNQALSQANQRLVLLGVILAALFMLCLIMFLLLSYSITKPIADLQQAAEYYTSGINVKQVSITGSDEFTTLAKSFNQLISQLSSFYQGLEQKVTDRTQELERRALEMQVATEVAREAASIRDLKSLLDQTTRLISERFSFYHVGIFLVDEVGDYAILQSANSEGGHRMLARGHKLKIGQVGIVGYVADRGEPRIALDVGADATYFNNPDLPSTRSEMALPLKARGQVIGVLDVQSVQAEAFVQQDINILQILADQVALAIDNARLFEESQKSIQELQTLYTEEARKTWRKQLENKSLAYLYNRIGVEAVLPDLEPAKSVSKTTVIEDSSTRQLCIPILIHSVELGSIILKRSIEETPWSHEDITFVEEAVSQIAQGLENARLVGAIQTQAYQEQLISQVIAKTQISLDLETVLKTAVQEIGLAMNAAKVQIRLGKHIPSDHFSGTVEN